MSIHRSVLRVAAVGALVSALGCAQDAPLAPSAVAPAPAASLLDLPDPLSLVACPNPGTATVTQVIGPDGGIIVAGPHSLEIPAGALSAPVAITATESADGFTGLQFEPHGLVFAKRATLTLSYAHCGALAHPRVVYVDDLLSILDILATRADSDSQTVSAKIGHFSGYLVAD